MGSGKTSDSIMDLQYINIARRQSPQTFFFLLLRQRSQEKHLPYCITRRIHQRSRVLRIQWAYQPTSRAIMDNPEVTYDTPEQMLAILGKDVDIYPYLSVCHQAQFIERDVPDDGKFSTFIYLYPYVLPSAETYDERPETIPFTREDLEAFGKDGLDSFHGYWSVHWAAESRQRSDKIHRDDYRSVMSFRSIEFMIRPIADYKKRDDRVVEPRRL